MLHYTGMRSAAEALERLCDPAAKVSAHYLIDEDGTVVALVPDELRAWHAGVSWWQGRATLNDVSLGIELVNPGHAWGYRPFPDAQMAALVELAASLVARFRIAPFRVVGHSDIAPVRKDDPGELFDWPRLAQDACVRRYPPPLLPLPTRCGPRRRWHGSAILARRRACRCSPCCGPSSAAGGRPAAMACSIPPPWVSCSPSSACRTVRRWLPRRRLQAAGWPLPPRGGGGKSGLHGNTVPGNARRGRPQGKCHREQTARRGRLRPACG